MADIVLVNPGGFELINDQTLPFGLLYSSIYAHKEFDIKIIDRRVDKDWKLKLLNELKKDPMVVGLTSMTGPQILDAIEISKLVKSNSNAKVVWGGIHASLLPEQTIRNKYIDMVVQSEGEITFYELVKALSKNKSLDGIKGLWYKKEGKIKNNPERELITDLDKLPRLPYHLIDIKKYFQIKESRENKKSLTIFTSKGCPHRCIYCFNAKFNKSCWRAMSSKRSLKEIKYIVDKFNLKNVFFVDDNFLVDPKRTEEIAKGILKEKLDITWDVLGATVITLSRFDKEKIKFFYKSGCRSFLFGIESGSQRLLNYMKKGITIEQILKINKNLNNTGIKAYYSFMSGFPIETKEDIKDTIKLMFKLEKDNKNINRGTIKPVVCFPGTELYNIVLGLGYKPPRKLEEWAQVTCGNYFNLDYHWLSSKRKKMLVHLYYYSLISNRDHLYINSNLFKIGTKILSPMATYRMKNFNFKLPLSSQLLRFVQKHFM